MQQYRRIAKTMNGKASNSYHSPRKILQCKILRRGAADEKGAAVGFAECPQDASCRDEKAWFVLFPYSIMIKMLPNAASAAGNTQGGQRMKIEKTTDGTAAMLSLTGSLDAMTADELGAAVAALGKDVTDLVLDLQKLE